LAQFATGKKLQERRLTDYTKIKSFSLQTVSENQKAYFLVQKIKEKKESFFFLYSKAVFLLVKKAKKRLSKIDQVHEIFMKQTNLIILVVKRSKKKLVALTRNKFCWF
jgi:hypothetical protein